MKDAYMDWFIHHFIQPPRQARVRLLAYTGGPIAAQVIAHSAAARSLKLRDKSRRYNKLHPFY